MGNRSSVVRVNLIITQCHLVTASLKWDRSDCFGFCSVSFYHDTGEFPIVLGYVLRDRVHSRGNGNEIHATQEHPIHQAQMQQTKYEK